MRILRSAVIASVLLILLGQAVEARVLPRYRGNSAPVRSPGISTRAANSIIVRPSFMPGRGGLRVGFSNLQNATSVNYVLSYDTGGKTEGVSGTISPSDGTSTSRDLQFATCSSGVCRNHGSISNMKLVITSKLTNGKTSIKRYRIRV